MPSDHPPLRQKRRRGATVRGHLVTLVLAVLLPVLAFTFALVWQSARNDRARLEAQTEAAARDVAAALDRELTDIIAAARVLAGNDALRAGDLAAFHRRAIEVKDGLGAETIAVRDAESRVLLNTSLPWGAPLAAAPVLAAADRAVSLTGRPNLSDVHPAPVTGTLIFAVVVPLPARLDGPAEAPRFLSLGMPLSRIQRLAERDMGLPAGSTAGVVDGAGIFVARSRDAAEWVGRPAPNRLREDSRGGLRAGRTAEGAEALFAWRRSELANWGVGVSVPLAALRATERRNLISLGIAGAGTLALGLLLAAAAARRVTRALASLSGAGAMLGDGGNAPLPRTGLAEVDDAVEALREAGQRLHRVQRIGRVGGFEIDLLAQRSRRSAEYLALQGLPPEAVSWQHEDWVRRLHPEDRERAERHFWHAVSDAGGTEYAQEYRIVTPGGEVRWISARAEIERDPATGQALRMRGAHVDVTELKRAEGALAANEARLRAVLDAVPVGVVLAEAPSGQVLFANRALAEVLGEAGPAEAAPWRALGPDGHRLPAAESPMARAVATRRPAEGEYLWERTDGARRWVHIAAVPVMGPDGALAGAVMACADVDAQRRSAFRQEFRLALADALRPGADPAAAQAEVAAALARHLGAAAVGFATLDAAGEWLTVGAHCNDGRVADLAGRWRVEEFGPELTADMRAGRTIVIPDVAADPRTAAPATLARFRGVRTAALLDVPLVREGRGVALLFVNHHVPLAWAEEDVALAEETAARLWAALERARAEAELRASEARLRSILAGMGEGFILLDRDFRILDVNPEAVRVDGRAREALLGRHLLEAWPEAEHSPTWPAYRRALAENRPAVVTTRRERNGAPLWLEVRAYPVEAGLAIFFRDVTDRVRLEAEAREVAERMALALEAGAVAGTFVWDVPADRVTGDERFARAFGQDPARLRAGVRLRDLHGAVHPEDLPGLLSSIADALRRGGPYRREYRLYDGEGWRWVLASSHVELGPDGAALRFPGVLLDIQERREAEAALAEAEQRVRLATEAAEVGFWDVDPESDGLVWPSRVKEMFGLLPDVPVTLEDFRQGLHPDDRDRVLAAFAAACDPARRALYDEEYRTIGRVDGRVRWVAAKGRGLFDAQGRCRRVLGTAIDVTERKAAELRLRELNETLEAQVEDRTRDLREAQERLAHAQRMEALGQLAGGIAHDFNNVLQAVQGGAALLDSHARDGEAVRRIARMVGEAAERGSAVTRRLLAFSRRGDLRAEPVAPAPLLRGLAEVLSHTLGGGIAVRVEAPDGLPGLLADRGQLETVLVNLATNGRDAMEGQGTLTLAAAAEEAGPGHPAGLRPGAYVRLVVADTGAGMTPEVLSRAAEPFFTTKPTGQGTGLGLAMAKGFAEQSGGAMAIRSARGEGTEVTLWLPVADGPPGAEDGPAAPARPPLRRRVLLADDDAVVRRLTAEALRDAGLSVTEAAGAAEALALLEAGAAADILVSDLSMPGLDGLGLIRQAQLARPGLPAILLTGFVTNAAELAVGGALSGAFSLLRKPVAPAALAERIAALLDEAPARG